MKKNLSIDFCNIPCENPFFLSSSCIAGNYEMCARALEMGWGGLVYKTIGFYIPNEVSPRFDAVGKEGTPFMGFKNLEQISDHPLEENLAVLKKLKENHPTKVIVASIMGETEEEWTKLAAMCEEAGVDIIECNFSCPQMTKDTMGSDVGQNCDLVQSYCAAARRGTTLPILAKMTPNIGNMEPPAIASMLGGADGIAAINTIKCITQVDHNLFSGVPAINGKSAVSGYSGRAVKPIALRFIYDLAVHPRLKNVPISGIGGIENWEDALDFLLLGASNLQVTTAVMQYGYRIIDDLIEGLSIYMEENHMESLSELIGRALPNMVSSGELDRSFIEYPQMDAGKCVGCGRCYISCADGGHQAISWSSAGRKPTVIRDKCVGCQLCLLVCPAGAIFKGEKVSK